VLQPLDNNDGVDANDHFAGVFGVFAFAIFNELFTLPIILVI
jgi:hypothetical protein